MAQSQGTLQRVIGQSRPATANVSQKLDDLFGSKYLIPLFFIYYILNLDSPPKTTTMIGDTDKNKKMVR